MKKLFCSIQSCFFLSSRDSAIFPFSPFHASPVLDLKSAGLDEMDSSIAERISRLERENRKLGLRVRYLEDRQRSDGEKMHELEAIAQLISEFVDEVLELIEGTRR